MILEVGSFCPFKAKLVTVGGLHSTEVAFAFLTQRGLGSILGIPENIF